ncbi:hypothetical protein GCM10010345_92060 [Streptomyces canarius]|uniref:Uncharacterized protein n=1 Tax=Streptomyces canarius TaxID=285453 RepID=A0ABQ3DCQ7_9ACTN|nr:hypothetical protein GCM10010345_92060 [Streptomyces canarius]
MDGGDAVLHLDQAGVLARQIGVGGAVLVADLELVVLHGHKLAPLLGVIAHGVFPVIGDVGGQGSIQTRNLSFSKIR